MTRFVLSLVAVAAMIAATGVTAGAQAKASPTAPAKPSTPAVVVNINTASVAEIATLPGIGEKTAARIVEYRQKNGPFKKVEELMNVRGIGEKNFLKLKPQLAVGQTKADHEPQAK
jgi:competence protein ComEA